MPVPRSSSPRSRSTVCWSRGSDISSLASTRHDNRSPVDPRHPGVTPGPPGIARDLVGSQRHRRPRPTEGRARRREVRGGFTTALRCSLAHGPGGGVRSAGWLGLGCGRGCGAAGSPAPAGRPPSRPDTRSRPPPRSACRGAAGGRPARPAVGSNDGRGQAVSAPEAITAGEHHVVPHHGRPDPDPRQRHPALAIADADDLVACEPHDAFAGGPTTRTDILVPVEVGELLVEAELRPPRTEARLSTRRRLFQAAVTPRKRTRAGWRPNSWYSSVDPGPSSATKAVASVRPRQHGDDLQLLGHQGPHEVNRGEVGGPDQHLASDRMPGLARPGDRPDRGRRLPTAQALGLRSSGSCRRIASQGCPGRIGSWRPFCYPVPSQSRRGRSRR